MDVKKILGAISFLKSEDPAAVSALIADAKLDPNLAKALDGNNKSEDLSHYVADHWNMGKTNKSATAEEVKVGPSQAASGGGAEKMIHDYSSPAHQMHAVAAVPEKLDAMMRGFGKSFELLAEGQAKIASLLLASLKKASEDEEDEEDEEEESEVVEINASRGKSFFRKAKKLIDQIKALKSDLEDMTAEERKNCKAQIKALTKKAELTLGKALTCAYAASSAELKKSIRDLATKSDINVVQEEEEEEEDDEEDEAGKAKKAADEAAAKKAADDAAAAAKAAEDAAKAKTDDKGNQADHLDTSNGNQAAQMKALETKFSEITEALKGVRLLEGSVKDMMDVLAGRSKLADKLPVVKAGATNTSAEKVREAIVAAEESGVLNDLEVFAARDIEMKLGLVKSGGLDVSILNDRIAKASPAVQRIFQGALAA